VHSGKRSLKVRAGGFNALYVLDVARPCATSGTTTLRSAPRRSAAKT
jgi:hypothetical protein